MQQECGGGSVLSERLAMAKSTKFSITGATLVASKTVKIATGLRPFAAQALNEEALDTLADSVELTPVAKIKGGTLRRSAKLVKPATGFLLEATLGYGTEYALYVHEIPPPPQKSPKGRSARHTVGQWKFLETAVNQRAAKFDEEIAGKIKIKMFEKMLGA